MHLDHDDRTVNFVDPRYKRESGYHGSWHYEFVDGRGTFWIQFHWDGEHTKAKLHVLYEDLQATGKSIFTTNWAEAGGNCPSGHVAMWQLEA